MERKLRILCLHGYRQNALKFKGRTGALKRCLKHIAELVYIDAPKIIPPLDDTISVQQFGWWTSDDPELSYDYLSEIWETQGPFDGVLGFSQGATCAALILDRFPFHFGIFIAGAIPPSGLSSDYFALPSLHIMGESDEIISLERSKALADRFEMRQVIIHAGGHYIPTQKEIREEIKTFVNKQVS